MIKLSKYFLILFILPQIVFGSVKITEVMYDVKGTDSGYEWIEVLNTGGQEIDLTTYKFFENNTAHSISHFSGSNLLAPGQYAVIADNAEKFITLFDTLPTSHIYDSAFSLSNSVNETLYIKDPSGSIVNEITYDILSGAQGDGNSLHVVDSGLLKPGMPSPLAGFNEESTSEDVVQSTVVSSSLSGVESGTLSIKQTKGFVFDIPKIAIIKNNIKIKATLYGDSGQQINQGYFVWNFGDGQIVESQKLDLLNHTYLNPGRYTISLVYKYNTWSVDPVYIGKWNINIIEPPFILTEHKTGLIDAVGIKNTKDSEYNIGSYMLRSSGVLLTIPKDTFIVGGGEIYINLPKNNYLENDIVLLDPMGTVVSSLPKEQSLVKNTPKESILANAYSFNSDFSQQSEPNLELNDFEIKPAIVVQQDSWPSVNNSIWYYWVLIVVLASILVFLIKNKIASKNKDLSSEEYALQDE